MLASASLFYCTPYMTHRHFIALTLFALITLTNAYGQDTKDKTATISQIRQVFQQINGYKNYMVVTIDDSEAFLGHATDNGGSLKGYYKGDSLVKMMEWIGLSNRVVQNEYYFDKGKLVFVYSTNSRCKSNDKTGEIDCSTFIRVSTARYYFSKDKLIEAILSDKEEAKTKQQDAADFLTSAMEYRKLLTARRRNSAQ
jgi:hypothetical protein